MQNNNLTFVTWLEPGTETETCALALIESIRRFGGGLARQPIWAMLRSGRKAPAPAVVKRLEELQVQLHPFENQFDDPDFFFTDQLSALRAAESLAKPPDGLIAWMDANTLVLQEPCALLLPANIQLGYRPVQHRLVGSLFDQPLDAFWSLIYECCAVPEERVFAMQPVVEDCLMRPYFNAGFMVTQPDNGLFHAWHEKFRGTCQQAVFQKFYAADRRYTIFMHQAVLAGVILARLDKSTLLELPKPYNYPVDLYIKDLSPNKPTSLDELVTLRYEDFFQDAGWTGILPASHSLVEWIDKKLAGDQTSQR